MNKNFEDNKICRTPIGVIRYQIISCISHPHMWRNHLHFHATDSNWSILCRMASVLSLRKHIRLSFLVQLDSILGTCAYILVFLKKKKL